MVDGSLYAVPFLIGTQLLFYRKDLFNDLHIRRLYFEKNKTALDVPATWQDYDRVAEFFTRSFNPESPVPYGTTLGGPSGSYCCVPRLWEAGISLFQPSKLAEKGEKDFLRILEETLSQYARAFMYADHVYQYESAIYRENISFAPLPNRISLLGGSIPSKTAVNSHEMRETYPWLSSTFNSAHDTRSLIDSGNSKKADRTQF